MGKNALKIALLVMVPAILAVIVFSLFTVEGLKKSANEAAEAARRERLEAEKNKVYLV